MGRKANETSLLNHLDDSSKKYDNLRKIQADVVGAFKLNKEQDEHARGEEFQEEQDRQREIRLQLWNARILLWWNDMADTLVTSLWTWPILSLCVNFLIGAAVARAGDGTDSGILFFFNSDSTEAGQFFRFICSMVMGLTGTVFSLSIVAFQVAGVTYSPRMLSDLMRKKATKVVLAIFLGTFSYSYAGLLALRNTDETQYSPTIAVNVCLIYVVATIVALVYYLDAVVRFLSVSNLLDDVSASTCRVAERLTKEIPLETTKDGMEEEFLDKRSKPREDIDLEDVLPTVPAEYAQTIYAFKSGYLLKLAEKPISYVASAHDVVIRFRAKIGEYVTGDTLLAWVWKYGAGSNRSEILVVDARMRIGPEELDAIQKQVNWCISIASRRSIENDIGFGIKQLTDVGVKGMSPGNLDPSTSCEAVDRLERVFASFCKNRFSHMILTEDLIGKYAARKRSRDDTSLSSDDGSQNGGVGFPPRTLVCLPRRTFADHLGAAINPMRWYGRTSVVVCRRLLYLLGALGAMCAPYGEQMATRLDTIENFIEDILNSFAESIPGGTHSVEFEAVEFAALHAFYLIHSGKSRGTVKRFSRSEPTPSEENGSFDMDGVGGFVPTPGERRHESRDNAAEDSLHNFSRSSWPRKMESEDDELKDIGESDCKVSEESDEARGERCDSASNHTPAERKSAEVTPISTRLPSRSRSPDPKAIMDDDTSHIKSSASFVETRSVGLLSEGTRLRSRSLFSSEKRLSLGDLPDETVDDFSMLSKAKTFLRLGGDPEDAIRYLNEDRYSDEFLKASIERRSVSAVVFEDVFVQGKKKQGTKTREAEERRALPRKGPLPASGSKTLGAGGRGISGASIFAREPQSVVEHSANSSIDEGSTTQETKPPLPKKDKKASDGKNPERKITKHDLLSRYFAGQKH
ncbi:hypothetical protein NDN08_007779 [Rhodosorus marinus]|uniref:DUF2254 domain-containing protein n=1 Tax=Rhodosorus marinus TaxID=101924 RepID=A0AAV8V2R3_9RHOD|nr:hypothetical protein NDN08_007779 [Rhodosorus marinus]